MVWKLDGGLDGDTGQVPLDALAFHQLRVSDRGARLAGVADDAVADLQALRRRAQFFGRHFQQHRARFGPGAAHIGHQQRRGHGAVGAAIVGAQVGIPQHHVDGIERHVQFLGQHLRQFGHDALAELHLAAHAGDPPIGAVPK